MKKTMKLLLSPDKSDLHNSYAQNLLTKAFSPFNLKQYSRLKKPTETF